MIEISDSFKKHFDDLYLIEYKDDKVQEYISDLLKEFAVHLDKMIESKFTYLYI